jgi:hypothetical protein
MSRIGIGSAGVAGARRLDFTTECAVAHVDGGLALAPSIAAEMAGLSHHQDFADRSANPAQPVRNGRIEVRAVAGFEGDQLLTMVQLHRAGHHEHKLLSCMVWVRVCGEVATWPHDER